MLRPLVSFLAIGIALFALDRLVFAGAPRSEPVVIQAQRVAELRAAFLARAGRMPSDDEFGALVRAEVDDELLYREALASGFDRDDPVVQRRLVQNMRFAGADPERDAASLYAEALELGMDRSDPVVRRRLVQRMRLGIEAQVLAEPPSEEALRAYYVASRDRYLDPARVRIVHRFFDGEPAGEAQRALESLRARGVGADAPADVGEPFLHAPRQPLQSERELAARFGPDFAAAVFSLPQGVWSGPVHSSYGRHLVYVQERVPSSQRGFEQVRKEVEHALQAERRRRALADHLASLRANVPVIVAGQEPR